MPQTDRQMQASLSPRLGRGMLYGAWILVLVLLTLGFNRWLAQQHNPNRHPKSTMRDGVMTVVLQRNRQGHYNASGSIDGVAVDFLLDTGATVVAIPGSVARRLRLSPGPAIIAHTANGDVTTYATQLARVRLGDIILRNVSASIDPQMDGDEVLLGMSFLKQLDFTQHDDTLTLRQSGDN